MKYLAVILALIIGTPSIADASNLAGTYLKCPTIKTPEGNAPLFLRFHLLTGLTGEFAELFNGTISLEYIKVEGNKMSYTIFSLFKEVGLHKISIYGYVGNKIKGHWKYIDRRTLKFGRDQCYLSSKQEAEREMQNHLQRGLRKNKF